MRFVSVPWGCVRAPTILLCTLLALTAASCNGEPTGKDGNQLSRQDTIQVLLRAPYTGRNPGGLIPATDGERIYTNLGGGISAYDAQNGSLAWNTPGVTYAPFNVLLMNGRVLVAEAVARSLDASTGVEIWRFSPSTDASLSLNAVDERAFYIGTRDHRVYALDLRNGEPLWTTDLGPEWEYLSLVKGISLSGDTLYAAVTQWRSENGHISSGWIVALDRNTGQILWRYSTGSENERGSVVAAPTVAGRMLLASDLDETAFFAVDRFTGKEVWRVKGPPGLFGPSQSPVVVEGIGYVASNDENVYAFDPLTGQILWKTHMPASIGAFAVCRDRIVVNYQQLGMLDRRTGKVLATKYGEENEFIRSGFAVDGDRVFVVGNQYLYAFGCE